MSVNSITRHAETLLIFALGVGLFVSKPVIYASSGALVALTLMRLSTDVNYRQALLSTRLTLACVGLFALGIIATAIHPALLDEIAWIARKSLYLLLLPVLFLAFKSPANRTAGFAGAAIGFWIAAILTMQSINWQWTGGRIAGATWLIDVWGVLTGMFASFLLPRLFQPNQAWLLRLLTAITLLAALSMMVMSGARGPWVGVTISGFIYLLLYQRKTLGILAILLIALYFPAKHIAPTQTEYLESRVTSIFKTAENDTNPAQFDASNWVRMQLWKISIAQDLHKLQHTPLTLLFGSGPNQQIHEMRAFFNDWTGMPQKDKDLLSSFGYPTNEVHNMYLDAVGKMGLIWTISSLLLILAVVVKGLQLRSTGNQCNIAVLLVTINFLVVGIFYDLLPHWATFFLVFFTMLAVHSGKVASDSRETTSV